MPPLAGPPRPRRWRRVTHAPVCVAFGVQADILRHLPRIVSILNGKPEPKNLVKSVFSSVVTAPPQGFGSVSSNLPRVRQSELLTPAELMVLLHESEKEIGLKAAIEGARPRCMSLASALANIGDIAIGVCFSLTDIFRSDILAVVMNQLVDEPSLPTLFMRTVRALCSWQFHIR